MGANPRIRFAFVCERRFEDLTGDGVVRFCDGCRQNVYDLDAFDADGQAALLEDAARGVPVCVVTRNGVGARNCREMPASPGAQEEAPLPDEPAVTPRMSPLADAPQWTSQPRPSDDYSIIRVPAAPAPEPFDEPVLMGRIVSRPNRDG